MVRSQQLWDPGASLSSFVNELIELMTSEVSPGLGALLNHARGKGRQGNAVVGREAQVCSQ